MRSPHALILAFALAAGQLLAQPTSFNDAIGDIGAGISIANGTLDIVSMEVSDTVDDVIFRLTVNGSIATTDWGYLMIGIANQKTAGSTTSNGWGRPIRLNAGGGNGMTHWIGSWVTGGGGSQLWTYNGASWDGPASLAGFSFAAGTQSSITYTVSKASLGVGKGDTIQFDAYSSGGGGGDSSVDALSNPGVAITSWGQTYTSQSPVISSYTLSLGTNPNPLDTDNDGVNDYREGKDGTDPLDPASFKLLSKDLVAYYPFNGNANDESGYLRDFATPPVFGTDRHGLETSAASFNSVNPIGTAEFANNSRFTTVFWLKVTSTPSTGGERIILQGSHNVGLSDERQASFGIATWADGRLAVSWLDTDRIGRNITLPAGTIAPNNWYQVFFKADGVNVSLGVNAQILGTVSGTLATVEKPISLGGETDYYFDSGLVDELRCYERALTQEEIQQLYYTEAFTSEEKGFLAAVPSVLGHVSQAEYDLSRANGQTDVTTDPASFNLFTQSQFDSNRISGQTDVTTSPSTFSLFTQNEVSESYTQGQNSVLQSIPSVDFSVPASTPFRVTLSGQSVIGVVVDDTESPLPDNWRLDEQAGQLIGSVVGSNPISVALEGEMAGDAPAIRIPLTFYPQAAQTIAPFARIPTQAFSLAPLTITPPAASSGFAVVLSVKSGPATIVDNQVTFTGVGKVVLAADQVGNKDMKAAPEVTTSFLVTKGRQNMSFTPLNSMPFVQGGTFQLSATTTSALPIAYSSSNPRVISISGSTATIVGRGVATIRATQSGDSNWAPAAPISRATRIY